MTDPFEITDCDGTQLVVDRWADGTVAVEVNHYEIAKLEPGEARALAKWLLAATTADPDSDRS